MKNMTLIKYEILQKIQYEINYCITEYESLFNSWWDIDNVFNRLFLSWAKQEDLRLFYKWRCPEKTGWFLSLLPLLKWMGYSSWLKGPSRNWSPDSSSSSQGRKTSTGKKNCNPTWVQYFFRAPLWWMALMSTAEGRILENDTFPHYQDSNNNNPSLCEDHLRFSVSYIPIPDRQFIPISTLTLVYHSCYFSQVHFSRNTSDMNYRLPGQIITQQTCTH